jgi:hypothetical protein
MSLNPIVDKAVGAQRSALSIMDIRRGGFLDHRLDELDRVARRVVDDDLSAADTVDDGASPIRPTRPVDRRRPARRRRLRS